MGYIIAVFKSRNETLYFANMLRQNNIFSSIINTPKEAGQACGISVRFDKRFVSFAKGLLLSRPFRAFSGFYMLTNLSNGRMSVERLW